jgi:hypothetical protein
MVMLFLTDFFVFIAVGFIKPKFKKTFIIFLRGLYLERVIGEHFDSNDF